MVALFSTLPGGPAAVASDQIPGLIQPDLPFVKSNPVPGDSSQDDELESKPLEDSPEELPEGSVEVDVADPWAEAGDLPIEVRSTDEVTTVPEDSDELATTEPIPDDLLPDGSNETGVEVSVEPSDSDTTPGLLLTLETEGQLATPPVGGVEGQQGVEGSAFRPGEDPEIPVPSGTPAAPGTSEPSEGPGDPTPTVTPSAEPTEEEQPGAEDPAEEEAAPEEADTVQAVEVRLSYAEFRNAFAGDWGSRLQVRAYPACFAVTPELPECSEGVLVPSVNDPSQETLTFTSLDLNEPLFVNEPSSSLEGSLGGGGARSMAAGVAHFSGGTGGVVYGVTAGASGEAGDYSATPFQASTQWQVGESSGEFTYTYPITMPPPAVAGPSPSLSLGYSSGSVDGMTKASNGQSSMVGMGWNFEPGHISRQYAKCSDDGLPNKGDLCWKTYEDDLLEEMSIVLGGRSSKLINIPGTSKYRLADDPAWQVQRFADGASEENLPSNTDNNNEAFKVSAPDGTTYWFGLGYGSGSTLTVPVYGNNAGEPCYDTTTSEAWCRQAYKWQLDRVLDRNGNRINYTYDRETNYYSRYALFANKQAYDRSGFLTGITYGKSRGTTAGTGDPDFSSVVVDTQLRCLTKLTNPTADCTGAHGPRAEPTNWPDVPGDLSCDSNDDCMNGSPSFWSTRRYDSVTTKRTVGGTTYNVDRYQFEFEFPTPGPNNGPGIQDLWLDSIQRTGAGGTPVTLPQVDFDGTFLRNRVVVPTNAYSFNKLRVTRVQSETGGRIDVQYGHDDGRTCGNAAGEHIPSQRYNSIYECFPQKHNGAWEWWHKYVVKRVALGDDALGYSLSQTTSGAANEGRLRVFDYEYQGTPGWRFRNNQLVPNEDETWDDWRGYETVFIHQRKVPDTTMVPSSTEDVSMRKVITFRGLKGSRLNDTTNNVRDAEMVETSKADYNDEMWRAGRVAEEVVYNLNNGTPAGFLSLTHNYYSRFITAANPVLFEPDASYVYASTTYSTPRWGGPERRVATTVHNGGDGVHTGLLLGAETMVVDNQATTTTTDDLVTCTKWKTSSITGSALRVPYETNLRLETQGCSTASGLKKRSVFYYDGKTYEEQATNGNLTKTARWTSGDLADRIATTSTYDFYGRVLGTSQPFLDQASGVARMTLTDYNPGGNNHNALTSVKTISPKATDDTAATNLTSTTALDLRRGLPSSITDANGKVTTITRDALGRPTAVNLPGNPTTSTPSIAYEYSISNTAPSWIKTTQLRVNSPTAAITTDQTYDVYDGWGRSIESQTVAANNTNRILTATAYDDRGMAYRSMLPAPVAGTGFSRVNPSFPTANHWTQTDSDGAGRPIRVYDNSGTVENSFTTYSYGTSAGGSTDTVTTYPASYTVYGQTPKVLPPALAKTLNEIDPAGRLAKVTQSANPNSTAADPVNDGVANYKYEHTGELAGITQPLATGNLTYAYTYDLLGRRKTAVDPDTGTTTYTYDEFGNPKTINDAMDGAAGDVIMNQYDYLGRPIQRDLVKSGGATELLATWAYGDSSANSVDNSKGRLTKTTSYNRDFGATIPDGTFTKSIGSYDAQGNPLNTTVEYPNSLLGEAGITTGTTTKTQSFTYNPSGQVLSTTYPAAGGMNADTAKIVYGKGGVFASMTMNNNGSIPGYAIYDTINRPNYLLSGSYTGDATGLGRGFIWGNNDRLTTLGEVTGANLEHIQLRYDYTYDALGNPTKIVNQRRDTPTAPPYLSYSCYSYDGISRLTRAATGTNDTCTTDAGADHVDKTVGAKYDLSYTYDRGMLKTATNTSSGGTRTATYTYPPTTSTSAAHAPTAIGHSAGTGSTTGLPTPGDLKNYDPVGRVKNWEPTGATTENLTYTYDGQGRLIKTEMPATTTKYAYDADGIRIARKDGTTTSTLYLGDTELIKTVPTSGPATIAARRHLTTPGGTPLALQTNTETTWLLTDPQQSIRFTKGATGGTTGGALQHYSYFPYGDPTSTPANLPGERGYLNKPHDPNGEIRLDHRTYDPSVNTLTTPDPILDLTDPQNLNAYAYSGNNPITFSDPTGLRRDDQDVPGSGNDRDFSSGNEPPPTQKQIDEETANIYTRVSGPENPAAGFTDDVILRMTDIGIAQKVASSAHHACRENLGRGCSHSVLEILWHRHIAALGGPGAFMGPPTSQLGAGIPRGAQGGTSQRSGAAKTLAGSGPVPGVLEASGRVKSFAALRNYNPKGGVEYVFDPATGTFAVGRPAASAGLKGSPHQQLAQSIGANPSSVVGGTLTRGSNGAFITTEQSGHFWQNWTPAVREQFVSTMRGYGFDVIH